MKRSKWIWCGMGAKPNRPPTATEVWQAKRWARSNLLKNKLPAYRLAINQMVPYRMLRFVSYWAWNRVPVRQGGDLFFDRQDLRLNHNQSRASDLSNTSLSSTLEYDITYRLKGGHDLVSYIKSLQTIDKDVDYPLRWITLGKNTYAFQGTKLMYDQVVRLSRLNGSVYSIWAPNIK